MEPLSLNRYSYTWGNPVNYQDPSGHGPLGSDGSAAAGLGLDAAANQAQLASVVDFCGENGAYVAGVIVEAALLNSNLGWANIITQALWDYVFGLTPFAAYYYQGKRDVDTIVETFAKAIADSSSDSADWLNMPGVQAAFSAIGAAIGGYAGAGAGAVGGTLVLPGGGTVTIAVTGEVVGTAIGTLAGEMLNRLLYGVSELSSVGAQALASMAESRGNTNQKKVEENGSSSGKNGSGNSSSWNKGSFDSAEESLEYHFNKHGEEVGAKDIDQYVRKAEEFAKTAKKGSIKRNVEGAVEGVIRYIKNGKYIDLAPDGSIVSFGKSWW